MLKTWFNICFVLDEQGYTNWVSVINKRIRLIKLEDFTTKEIDIKDLLMDYKPVPEVISNKISNNPIIMKMITSYEEDWRKEA